MSRILDAVLEPQVTYTGNTVTVRVKVQDDYFYKSYIITDDVKYTTVTGTTFTLTNAINTNNGSISILQGNTTQNGTPSPSSPIPISTVSGDNEVVVCGKNLFDKSTVTNGYYLNESGGLTSNANYCVSAFIPVNSGQTYYLPTRRNK